MSCASLRCACQEASAKLGILATRLRAGLPLPSGQCHCAQRCRKSSAAAGVPATAEPECRGVGPDWGSEKSACARNAIGAQSGVDTRQKINRIRATLRSRLREQRVAIGFPLRGAPSKSARGQVFSDFNITRRCLSRMIIGSVLFVPPQRPLVTTKSFFTSCTTIRFNPSFFARLAWNARHCQRCAAQSTVKARPAANKHVDPDSPSGTLRPVAFSCAGRFGAEGRRTIPGAGPEQSTD
jgi:hypothetical protein